MEDPIIEQQLALDHQLKQQIVVDPSFVNSLGFKIEEHSGKQSKPSKLVSDIVDGIKHVFVKIRK